MTATSTPDIETIQDDIIARFSACRDWDARYQKIIELGKALPAFPEEFRTEANQVKGCQSQVWLHAALQPNPADPQAPQVMHLYADSDALLVRGLIALLVQVYSDQPPATILATPPRFLEAIQLTQNLSMQRNNGLAAVLKQIKLYATVFMVQGQA
jgi:cysteine desulfuration protein SufE